MSAALQYAIALDVGGTAIKVALVRGDGHVPDPVITTYPAYARERQDVIIEHFAQLIAGQADRVAVLGGVVAGVAMAFPGPFDYRQGISFMQGQDKYDALYGMPFGGLLHARLLALRSRYAALPDPLRIVYENDVIAVALGLIAQGKASRQDRVVCITIGTGTGGCFVDAGQLVADRADVPKDGWIWDKPFRDGMIDDYVSARGVLRIARDMGMSPHEMSDVKVIADAARAGDVRAQTVFETFGGVVADALHPYLLSFRPQTLAVGGQIAKSMDLFAPALLQGLSSHGVAQPQLILIDDTSLCACHGIAARLFG